MKNLKYLRKQKKMTQGELAKALSVSISSICDWETGGAKPHIDIIGQVADYFNVSVDFLIGRESADGVTYPQRYIEANEEEKQILFDYRNLSEEYKNNLKLALHILEKADK